MIPHPKKQDMESDWLLLGLGGAAVVLAVVSGLLLGAALYVGLRL